MYKFILRTSVYISATVILCSCAATKKATQVTANIAGLKFLNVYEVPYNFKYANTIVGGLSGIDYDVKNISYYLISDDRSDKNPARFYSAKIFISQKGIDSMNFTGVKSMLQPSGDVYPNNKQDKFKVPDPEAMRYNAVTKQLVWSSEGERIIKPKDTVLINPSVIIINTNGKYVDSFTLPPNLKMQSTERGPRRNSVLEGMTYADNFKTLFVNVEEPLYEDGPQADVVENDAFIRIIKFDAATKKPVAQYAYKLEPVAYLAKPKNEFKINGVSDILSLGDNKLLVIERSFSTGRLPCTIRVFIADLNNATDISLMQLKSSRIFTPATKTLLLNMDKLGIYIDNIEGVTFGPVLPNGHKTLLFISDNNFNAFEKTQVLLFEVTE